MTISMTTFTGRTVNPSDLTVADIDLNDIAHSLAYQCRYGAHTRCHYSVAQHSILLSKAVPSYLAQAALIHDAVEAYIVDLPQPVKQYLPDYSELELKAQRVIFQKFGVDFDLLGDLYPFDRRICVDEMNQLFDNPPSFPGIKPLRIKINPMDAYTAEDAFIERFYELFPNFNTGPAPAGLVDLAWMPSYGNA